MDTLLFEYDSGPTRYGGPPDKYSIYNDRIVEWGRYFSFRKLRRVTSERVTYFQDIATITLDKKLGGLDISLVITLKNGEVRHIWTRSVEIGEKVKNIIQSRL